MLITKHMQENWTKCLQIQQQKMIYYWALPVVLHKSYIMFSYINACQAHKHQNNKQMLKRNTDEKNTFKMVPTDMITFHQNTMNWFEISWKKKKRKENCSVPKADRLRMKRSCEFPGSGFNIT